MPDPRLPIAGLIGVLLLAACGGDGPGTAVAAGDGAAPLTVQNCGREVVLDAPPQRIVTIGSEAPRLVAAAGGADRLVAMGGAVDPQFFGADREVLEPVPRLGGVAAELSTEVLLAQEPDLVISINDEPFEALAAAGVPGLVISGRCLGGGGENAASGSFEEIYADIGTYGALFGTTEVAEAAVDDLRERVEAVQQRFADAPGRTALAVLYGSGGPDLGAYGGSSVAGTQLEALGLTNAFGEQDERFFEPSVEEVVDRDPDVLAVLYEPVDRTEQVSLAKLRSAPELAGLRALREDRILTLSFTLAVSSPGAVEGLEQLAEQLSALDAR